MISVLYVDDEQFLLEIAKLVITQYKPLNYTRQRPGAHSSKSWTL